MERWWTRLSQVPRVTGWNNLKTFHTLKILFKEKKISLSNTWANSVWIQNRALSWHSKNDPQLVKEFNVILEFFPTKYNFPPHFSMWNIFSPIMAVLLPIFGGQSQQTVNTQRKIFENKGHLKIWVILLKGTRFFFLN